LRLDLAHAHDPARHAPELALLALAHVAAAGVADLARALAWSRRVRRVHGAVDAVGGRAGLVDLAVAVVVEAVADLGLRAGAAAANELAGSRRVALQLAALAEALRAVAGVRLGVELGEAGAAEGKPVVDLAVAVVVEAVAGLGLRLGAVALQLAVHAVL